MDAQGVKKVREGGRHPQMVGAIFQPLQLVEQILHVGGGCAQRHLRLDELQFSIKSEDTAAHGPAVCRRQQADQREDHCNHRNQDNQQASN